MSAQAALTRSYDFNYTCSYFTLRHSLSTNTLSRQAPRLSIDSLQSASTTTQLNSSAVNWLPWSVLKMSGVPYFANTSSMTLLGVNRLQRNRSGALSTCFGDATALTRSLAATPYFVTMRLRMKPSNTPDSRRILLILRARLMQVAMTSQSIFAPRTTSSRRMTSAGLNKCRPITSRNGVAYSLDWRFAQKERHFVVSYAVCFRCQFARRAARPFLGSEARKPADA
jgi:hypothetical protein